MKRLDRIGLQLRSELVERYGSEKRAFDLTHLDYQALIVVASMQQAFEQRGIADYARVEWSSIRRRAFVEYVEPVGIWVSRAIRGGASVSDQTSVEVLRVELFQYQKKLSRLGGDWWRTAVYRCYLAISHKYKKVLYFIESEPEIVDAPLRYVKE